MRPAGRVQLVVGNGAAVLVRAVGGQVLGPHTGGVLGWAERGRGKRQETQEGLTLGGEKRRRRGQDEDERSSWMDDRQIDR